MTSASFSCALRELPWSALLLLAVVASPGCGKAADGPTLYGSATSAASLVETAQPLGTLKSLPGTETPAGEVQPSVTVRGTIGKVCQSMGCWFYLTDETSMLLIDLEQGSRFTIPKDATGRTAIVRGRLAADGGDRRIVATAAAIFESP